ncbi:MAG: response regulator [Burkholderiaceae bacterium]|nr:response regulator [Burkholderiaceae bacterium]
MKLLIVDDSSLIRNRIARLLGAGLLPASEIAGMARNGVEAVRAFREHRPALVTMDLTMPEMDGIACIKALVAIDPDVRILVVSALSDKATALQALKMGAQGFLYKPFTDDQLADALAELAQPA